MQAATDEHGPHYVPPAGRIATFDNDGTLWVEQPVYTQVVFAVDRVSALRRGIPIGERGSRSRRSFTPGRSRRWPIFHTGLRRVVAETHAGISVEEFAEVVRRWLDTAHHPRFKRPYTELVYQPMLEVLHYLRANGFKTYIVTGGGQDFVRVRRASLRRSARAGHRFVRQDQV